MHKEADWVYVVNGEQYTDQHPEGWSIAGFNQTSFGWKSDQPATDKFPAGVIEMQRSKDGQVYAEMVAESANCAIYLEIKKMDFLVKSIFFGGQAIQVNGHLC